MSRLRGAMLSVLALVGCLPPAIPHVVRGEAPSTGHPTFDAFFLDVREVHQEAEAAEGDVMASYASLVKALGIEPYASTLAMIDASGQRAKKLADKGVLLHLDVAPVPKFMVSQLAPAKGDLGIDTEALLRAMEGSAKSSLDMRKRLDAAAARAVDLEKRRAKLRMEVLPTFRQAPQAKREEVITELDAAKGVLSEASDKANRAAGAAVRFVIDLAQVVETGAASDARLAKPAKRSAAATSSLAAPSAGAAASSGAATPAKPAPLLKGPGTKKPKSNDDFEP